MTEKGKDDTEKGEVGMEELKDAVEADERIYPAPLHAHEVVARDRPAFMESLRHFHSSMTTKFM